MLGGPLLALLASTAAVPTGKAERPLGPSWVRPIKAAQPSPTPAPEPNWGPPDPTQAETPPDPTRPFPSDEIQPGRRRPDARPEEYRDRAVQDNPGAIRSPPPEAFDADNVPIPDRWRLIETLGIVRENYLDPYNQNTLKGDRPICDPRATDERHLRSPGCRLFRALGLEGDDWFVAASAVSDTVIEPRSFPIPVGVQTTDRPGNLDVFGIDRSLVLAQTFILSASLIKGNTAYRPPDVEYRLAVAFQTNYADVSERRVLFVEPTRGTSRVDTWVGVQEAFVDLHLRNVSQRYDFDSIRVGIQPLQFDFRGFLFNDNNLAIRLFGNRDNNRLQYNLIGVWRLEKDTNSGLNNVTVAPRSDWILHANLFRQDLPVTGLTSEISLTWNINRERDDLHIDDNGFPVRPALLGDLRGREYDVVYVGYNGDGHFGRVNLTVSAYGAFGQDRNSFFTSRPADIRAWFIAAEPSMDFDWIRVRLSGLYASGDKKPYNNVEGGFDAIFENPVFAGADTSYWIRQTIPFAGGGRAVGLNGRNGVLNSLRSSKEQGQSNFNNPGTILVGAGADFDITPTTRLTLNANHLWFANTATLKALRVEGSIPKDIGFDLSAAGTWRPKANQNLVFRLSGAVLQPGDGFKDLFGSAPRDHRFYSVLLNAILTY